jgi:hypothetical protein
MEEWDNYSGKELIRIGGIGKGGSGREEEERRKGRGKERLCVGKGQGYLSLSLASSFGVSRTRVTEVCSLVLTETEVFLQHNISESQ